MVVLSEGWWGESLRMSQPVHLSPPQHPHHNHSLDEDAVTSSKSFSSEAAGGWQFPVRLPRKGEWCGQGRRLFFIHKPLFFILIWHIFFSRRKLQLLPKDPEWESSNRITANLIFFWNCGVDLSILMLYHPEDRIYAWLTLHISPNNGTIPGINFLDGWTLSPYFENLLYELTTDLC